MSSIRLVTSKREIIVSLDDPVFADLLAPINELGEDVDELVLTSTVEEIFEAEWDSAKRLIDWMSEYRKMHGCLLYHTDDMAVYLGDDRTLSCNGLELPNISLSQVARMRYVLNLPERWETCVSVDDHSKESMNHLSTVGRLLLESKDNPYVIALEWSPLMRNLRELSNSYESDPPGSWNVAVAANLRNAALRYARPVEGKRRRAMLQDLDWEALKILADSEGEESVNETRMASLSSSYNFSGVIEIYVVFDTACFEYGKDLLLSYYAEGMSSLPECVDPVDLGLGYILSGKRGEIQRSPTFTRHPDGYAMNDFLGVVRWVHETITLMVLDTGCSGDVSHDEVKQVAYVMYVRIVGKDGLERIRSSLNVSVRSMEGEVRERVEAFLEGIEHELSDFDYKRNPFQNEFP